MILHDSPLVAFVVLHHIRDGIHTLVLLCDGQTYKRQLNVPECPNHPPDHLINLNRTLIMGRESFPNLFQPCATGNRATCDYRIRR